MDQENFIFSFCSKTLKSAGRLAMVENLFHEPHITQRGRKRLTAQILGLPGPQHVCLTSLAEVGSRWDSVLLLVHCLAVSRSAVCQSPHSPNTHTLMLILSMSDQIPAVQPPAIPE